tara:strand:- start:605 stop:1291 length:687 start_codon:yes stop_codon:yes gene_type:complete
MKKTLLALTTALTVLPALNAQADWTPPQVYLGAQAGGTFAYADFDTYSNANNSIVKLSNSKGENFLTAGVFAGARYFFGDFFGGLEVAGNWDGMNMDADAFDSRAIVDDFWRLQLKRRWQVIPSAVVGWKMNEKTAFYAKFGAGISEFALVEGRGQPSENVKTDTIVHFVPALGTEYEVHKNVGVRLEVSGEFFGRDIKGASGVGTLTQNTKVSYNGISVKLGVLLKV